MIAVVECARQDEQFLLLYVMIAAVTLKVVVWPAFSWLVERGKAHRERVLGEVTECE